MKGKFNKYETNHNYIHLNKVNLYIYIYMLNSNKYYYLYQLIAELFNNNELYLFYISS